MAEYLGSTNSLNRAATLLDGVMILEKGHENRREWSRSLIKEGKEMINNLSREARIDQIIDYLMLALFASAHVLSHQRLRGRLQPFRK